MTVFGYFVRWTMFFVAVLVLARWCLINPVIRSLERLEEELKDVRDGD